MNPATCPTFVESQARPQLPPTLRKPLHCNRLNALFAWHSATPRHFSTGCNNQTFFSRPTWRGANPLGGFYNIIRRKWNNFHPRVSMLTISCTCFMSAFEKNEVSRIPQNSGARLTKLSVTRRRQSRSSITLVPNNVVDRWIAPSDDIATALANSRTFGHAKVIGNCAVSVDHRQPTSPSRVSSPSPKRPCGEATPLLCRLRRGPSMQWKPVSNDFQPPPVQSVGLCEVHVANKHVQTNVLSLPCKPLLPQLQHPTSSPEPCCCAGCAVVAKSAEWTATLATREGAKEQHTENLGINP